MDSLSTAEIYELYFMVQEQLDVQFQYWLSISFALVIATYIGRETIEYKIRRIASILYMVCTVMFFFKYISSMSHAARISMELTLRDIPAENVFGLIVLPLRVIIFVCGTLTTIWFVHKKQKVED